MGIQPDAVITLERADFDKMNQAIDAVEKELGVKPTKLVLGEDQILVCYRPWYESVFREAFEKLTEK